jgi:23S rRNA pseudouridine1911/1915/1917 synthase
MSSHAVPPSLYQVQAHEGGLRLDHYLVQQLPQHSRSSIAQFIRDEQVLVNNKTVKPGYKLHSGDHIHVQEAPFSPQTQIPEAQDIAFPVLFEDPHLLIISKPPGLVVHPAAGHSQGTLVNGLVHRYGELLLVAGERPGIVHRLDKDTSGIMLVARTETAHRLLAAAFKSRQIHKTYHALLLRTPPSDTGRITSPLGRHPVHRQKMAIRPRDGRHALSIWRVVERFSQGFCLAEIQIETGRTHQIRVHMSSMGAPVAGDQLYGGKTQSFGIQRQLLHASSLSFVHPLTGEDCHFTAPLWPDMEAVLTQLRQERDRA